MRWVAVYMSVYNDWKNICIHYTVECPHSFRLFSKYSGVVRTDTSNLRKHSEVLLSIIDLDLGERCTMRKRQVH